jgi:Icc-related predicted phosphoesterase
MVRIAALADLHAGETSGGTHRELLAQICEQADILALGGDLTEHGLPHEAEVLAEELVISCKIPIVAVLGNHDYEKGQQDEIKRILCHSGVQVLDGDACEVHGVGFAGVKGFCGGFDRYGLPAWGEEIIKRFVRETIDETLCLEAALAKLHTERTIVVLHYAPIRQTVEGEPAELFPFLGSSRLAEPIDRFGVSVVVHGHAHHGSPTGTTARGIPVYNVSLPLLRRISPHRPYALIEL